MSIIDLLVYMPTPKAAYNYNGRAATATAMSLCVYVYWCVPSSPLAPTESALVEIVVVVVSS